MSVTKKVDEYGNIEYRNEEGYFHREDGPAEEWTDGTKFWSLNGGYHREDGPAVELSDGSKAWFLNGRCHREDGPAIIRSNGTREWYLDGKRHREDGPAFICSDGRKYWWLNGVLYLEEEEWKTEVAKLNKMKAQDMPAQATQHKCHCEMMTIMATGCQCGGT